MREQLIRYFLPVIIKSALSSFSIEQIKIWLDAQIDALEEHIVNSPTRIDDAFLPVIKVVRETFDLPDLPDRQPED